MKHVGGFPLTGGGNTALRMWECNLNRIMCLNNLWVLHGGCYVYVYCHVFAAVLFLEFWKRRQFQLQYDWDMLGYEDAEVDKTHM